MEELGQETLTSDCVLFRFISVFGVEGYFLACHVKDISPETILIASCM
jgi:hypothetical protein